MEKVTLENEYFDFKADESKVCINCFIYTVRCLDFFIQAKVTSHQRRKNLETVETLKVIFFDVDF